MPTPAPIAEAPAVVAAVVAEPSQVAPASVETVAIVPLAPAVTAVATPASAPVAEVDLPWNEPAAVVAEPEVVPVATQPLPVAEAVVTPAAAVSAAEAAIDEDEEGAPEYDYEIADDSTYAYMDALPDAPELPSDSVAPAALPATGLAAQWLEIYAQLGLGGLTGSIAANCSLMAVEGDNWLLHLDPAQSALFNASQQRRINDALNQLQGRSINLDIQLCKPEQETPAQAAARKRGERQAEAEASIHADPLIQQMQQQFAAQIRPESIVPVDGVAA